MNKQQMVINDVIDTIFRIEDKQTKFQDLVEEIKNKYKFPQNAICQIKVDGIEKQNNELVSAYAKQKINVTCSHIIPIQLMHPYLGCITVRADVCQQIIELEKLIAQKLFPIKYEILLNDLQPEKNKFLSQINYESLKLKLVATFYVTYENVQKIFRVEAFQQCQAIKLEVFKAFNITEEAELIYNKVPLENSEIFASYLVPLLSEIKIQIKTHITLTIKFNEILHKFITKKNQKIETIIESLRKFFTIHIDQKIILRCRGSNLNPKKTLEESQITQDVTMELKLDPITQQIKVRLYLIGSKIYFLQFVRNNQPVSVLDKLLPFQNKVCTYYLEDKQLNKHVSFIENGINDVQEINLSVETIEQQQIKIRFEGPVTNHVDVYLSDSIQQALKQFNPNKLTITAFYYNKQIEITQTYQSLNIQDGDTIVYKLTEQESSYMITINGNVEKINFNSKHNGKQLIEFVQKKFKIKSQCRLEYGGLECPLDKPICDFEEEDQIFELIQQIPIRAYVEKYRYNYEELFYENQTIENLKTQIKKQFDLDDEIQIRILIDDEEKQNSTQLGLFKDQQLEVKFLGLLKLKLIDQDGKLIQEVSVEKTQCFRSILKSSGDFRCMQNDVLLDNDQEFKDIFENQTDVTVKVEYQKKGYLKEMQNEKNYFEIYFFQDQSIIEIVSQYLTKKYQIYYESQLIDENFTFQQLNLKEKCCMYFQILIDVQINNKNNKILIEKKTYASTQTIKSIISKSIKYEVEILYKEQKQDQNKQLKEFMAEDDDDEIVQLTFTLIELIQITILVNQTQTNYKVDRSETLQYFRKLKEYQDQSKQFYFQDLEVQENKSFSLLYDQKQQVTLIFKAKQKVNTEQVYQPSMHFPNTQKQGQGILKKETKPEQKFAPRQAQQLVQQSPTKQQNPKATTKIKIQEILPPQIQQPKELDQIRIKVLFNDETFDEIVNVNITLRNFITNFENKNEFSNVTLFYEGEQINDQKTFKQLNIKDGDEFEIYQ